MLVIRFSRVGKRNRAQYRIVVQEKTVAPTGRHVAVVGSWDPHLKKGVFKTKEIKHWIGQGAQVSDSVWNLLIREEVIEGKKRPVKVKIKKKAEEEKEEGREKESSEKKSEEESEGKKEKQEEKAEAQSETAENKEEKETEVSDKKEAVKSKSE